MKMIVYNTQVTIPIQKVFEVIVLSCFTLRSFVTWMIKIKRKEIEMERNGFPNIPFILWWNRKLFAFSPLMSVSLQLSELDLCSESKKKQQPVWGIIFSIMSSAQVHFFPCKVTWLDWLRFNMIDLLVLTSKCVYYQMINV